MEEDCRVPPPVKLNCWKHHSGFIKEQISKTKGEKELQHLTILLRKIGESQMDLYLGDYSPSKISDQILNRLKTLRIHSIEDYKNWLKQDGKEYKLLKIKDKSVWTLRLGEDQQRFIHIHPGRYSLHAVRVKSLTLKTVICILSWQKVYALANFDLNMINMIRKNFLKAPPLKSIKTGSGLQRLISVLKD